MGKEVKLEELIDSLVSNPFLTRNQIPRTPENLSKFILLSVTFFFLDITSIRTVVWQIFWKLTLKFFYILKFSGSGSLFWCKGLLLNY